MHGRRPHSRLTCLLFTACCLCLPFSSSTTVKTTNGLITGHAAENRSSVTEYLGIPYAQPPINNLRFTAPQPLTGKTDYHASTYGFDCPQGSSEPLDFDWLTPQAQQIIDYFGGNAGTTRDEDCLTLNIWTQDGGGKPGGCAAARPIMVFFYGGRTAIGTTNTPFYNGANFAAAEDVVVVTVNYRLNIFGFPGAPNLEAQNLGFRDQRLAVEWVRDNAAAFGGDASKITIWGQSSGGFAVDYWAYAYREEPVVSGLISQSGNAFSFPLNEPEVTVANWYNVSEQVGCGSEGDAVDCMREKDWQIIEDAAASLRPSSGGNPIRSIPPFYPVVDGETVMEDYVALAKAGKFARIPYLLGNNNNEQGYYILPATAAGAEVTAADEEAFLLSSFTCPNAFAADQRRAYDVPVWQYRYFGDWPNLRLYNDSGAYHGSDLEMVFGNDAAVSGIASSDAEIQMTALMQNAWAAFARDPEKGLREKAGWPEYNSGSESLIVLGRKNRPVAEFVRPSEFDADCDSVALGALATHRAERRGTGLTETAHEGVKTRTQLS